MQLYDLVGLTIIFGIVVFVPIILYYLMRANKSKP